MTAKRVGPYAPSLHKNGVWVCGPDQEIEAEVSVKLGPIRNPSNVALSMPHAPVDGVMRKALRMQVERAFALLMEEMFPSEDVP